MSRIVKKVEASPLETQISDAIQAVVDGSEEDMKKSLNNLKITGAKEVQSDGLTVIIVVVPYKQISLFRAVQGYLIPELEKKLNNAQVIIVGKRRAFPKTPVKGRRYRAIRPTGRTLRSVNECLLYDVVYPTSIVGRRVHYDTEGHQVTHVILDQHDKTRVEDKLHGFSLAYNKLTGLRTVFEISEH